MQARLAPLAPTARLRLRISIQGAVQGVGFRPFVYRLARALGLAGWVENSGQGVTIEVEGPEPDLAEFRRRLVEEPPPRALLGGVEARRLDAVGEAGFVIRDSDRSGARSAFVLPDVATCADCLRELLDPADRRYRYPFVNCTSCGPRYSIVLELPYDRERTTMARFTMCRRCRVEYEDPGDRRFHAEPNACPACGPQLELLDERGRRLERRDGALQAAAEAVRQGRVLAVKGLGGFHLMVDARSDDAVGELRGRKRREAKPLAVMVPSLASARALAALVPEEEALLLAPEAPIVLARRRAGPGASSVSAAVAPDAPGLGLLLPYTPLHHLLLAELGFPVVATSGNRSDEPICTDERDAVTRLRGIADRFLVHDRPIGRRVDDSVVRVVAGRSMLLRRARGYAPLPVARAASSRPVLAVGGHLKNAVALAAGGRVFVSPHVGDLDTPSALEAFRGTIDGLQRLYEVTPRLLACDAHPDYRPTQWARGQAGPVVAVQHHHAHVLSCMADNEIGPPALGIAWDGSGWGGDGTVWGGEGLRILDGGFERVAWLRRFPLPGGETAVREPRRSAAGALHALLGARLFEDGEPALALFTPAERGPLRRMLERGVNCPLTSSAGRLFDAVAALAGLHPVARFEGQAALALESALAGQAGDAVYPFEVRPADGGWVVDWGPMLDEVRRSARAGAAPGPIALAFHNTLVEMIVAVAARAGEPRVLLTGGCFQNLYLSERAIRRLREEGFEPYWHRGIPPNDGGIAVGQALAAAETEG
jgi:hydrogenase maturation protein HypF